MHIEKADLKQILLAAIASTVDKNSAIYVAGPLATGIEYYSKLAAGEDTSMIRPLNDAKMRQAVSLLRISCVHPIIDPSVLKIPDWTPTEIGDFYIDILKIFAIEARFMPGWQFSSGATKEFAFSLKSGKRCLDLEGNEITRERAANEVKSAALKLDRMGIKHHKFHDRSNLIMTIQQ